MPITKLRLIGAAVTALGFGVMFYLASAMQNLFTLAVYIVLGVTVGFAIGYFEAKHVLSHLSGGTQVSLLKITLLSTVLILLPFLLVGALYGFSEIRLLLAYVVLPAIPAYLGVSGWQYQRFETENSVQIYSAPYSFKLWTQPVIGYSDQFYHFLRAVQTKDGSSMWQHIGYTKIYLRELEKRQDLSPEAKQNIRMILKTFSPYRTVGLTIFALFIVGLPLILAFSFTGGFGLLNMPLKAIMNITMPIVGVLFVSVFAATFLLMHLFKKKVAKILSQTDLQLGI
jgi:hypothetical protein